MKNKLVLIILLLAVSFLTNYSKTENLLVYNANEGDTIFWSKSYSLCWEDFKSPTRTSEISYLDANSSINFIIEPMYNPDNSDLILNMSVFFIKSESWLNKKELQHSKKLSKLLRHEQYHFNIGEMILRKFRKDVLLNAKNDDQIADFLATRFSYYDSLSHYTQNLYDKETMHSIDSIRQARWEKAIDDSLKLYDAYANPIVVVK